MPGVASEGTKLPVAMLAAALAALALLPASAGAIRKAQPGTGSWFTVCKFVSQGANDPIVHPDHPGASHMHDFFGNPSINAFSTRRSLLRSPGTCTRPSDRSAYWSPAFVKAGTIQPIALEPRGITVYYRARGRDPETIKPFPKGLRIIGGNPASTVPQDTSRVGWYCGATVADFVASEPRVCPLGVFLVARLEFPDCSNGRVDSPDHQRHMAYSVPPPVGKYRVCPPSHPIPVPAIRMHIAYRWDAAGTAELSSGGIYSLHADFFDAWRGNSVERLIDECIKANLMCERRPGT
jgi:hypothetical protein